MFPSQVDFLRHILDECNYLLEQYGQNTFDDLLGNKTLSHAFCRSLEIIGEAAKNIHPDLKAEYPLVDWKRIAGIRDKIIHNYFGVDHKIIWDTVENNIPELQQRINAILQKEKPSN